MQEKRTRKKVHRVWCLLPVTVLVALAALWPGEMPLGKEQVPPTRLEATLPTPPQEVPEAAEQIHSRPLVDIREVPPEEKHYHPGGLVEESRPVADTYFEDVVFLGDSRTEGLYIYGQRTAAEYLYAMGATVESVFTKKDWGPEEEKIPLLEALKQTDRSKIYVMLGVNELGWPETDMFRQRYAALLEQLSADHPEAEVVIQSILPVSARQDKLGTYVNNGRIDAYNAVLAALAEELRYPYVDVAEAVRDEEGCLRADLTYDGVHLNSAGCRVWLDYLRTHAI